MGRVCLLVLVLLASPGCFVLEELDKGREIMDQHAPKERGGAPAPAARSAAAPSKEAEEGLVGKIAQRAQAWWTERNEPEPPERDPDDVVVRCELAGGTRFMRKHDCELQGGRGA